MLLKIAQLFIFLHQSPKYQAFDMISDISISATDNITIITPKFVLTILLIILL